MNLCAQIKQELSNLKEYGIIVPVSALLDKKATRSLMSLSWLLFEPESTKELLLFLLHKAISTNEMSTTHLTFQSSLFLLSQYYNIPLPKETFCELRSFCEIMSQRFTSNSVTFLRHCSQANPKLNSFGLYSARSIREWSQGIEIEESVAITSLLTFLSFKRKAIMNQNANENEEIPCILSLDGFVISPAGEVWHDKVYGLYKQTITIDKAKEILNDIQKLNDAKYIGTVEIYSLSDINGDRFHPIAVIPVSQHGKRTTQEKVSEIQHVLKHLSLCYDCMHDDFVEHKSMDGDWFTRVKGVCNSSEGVCSKCNEKRRKCKRVKLIAAVADQGDMNLTAFKILQETNNNIIFIHDLYHIIKNIRNSLVNHRVILRQHLFSWQVFEQRLVESKSLIQLRKSVDAIRCKNKLDGDLVQIIFSEDFTNGLFTPTELSQKYAWETYPLIHSTGKFIQRCVYLKEMKLILMDDSLLYTCSIVKYQCERELLDERVFVDTRDMKLFKDVLLILCANNTLYLKDMGKKGIKCKEHHICQEIDAEVEKFEVLSTDTVALVAGSKVLIYDITRKLLVKTLSFPGSIEQISYCINGFIVTCDNKIFEYISHSSTCYHVPWNIEGKINKIGENRAGMYVLQNDVLHFLNESIPLAIKVPNTIDVVPIMDDFLIIKDSCTLVLTNLFSFAELSNYMQKLWKAIYLPLTDLCEPLSTAVSYFAELKQELKVIVGDAKAVRGDLGSFPDPSVSSLSMLHKGATKIIQICDNIGLKRDQVKTKTFTTINLENFFSLLRLGTDRSPSYIALLKRLRLATRCRSLMHNVKNRKINLKEEMIYSNFMRIRRNLTIDKESMRVLFLVRNIIGKSPQLGPTSIYKDRLGSIPANLLYIQKIHVTDLSESQVGMGIDVPINNAGDIVV